MTIISISNYHTKSEPINQLSLQRYRGRKAKIEQHDDEDAHEKCDTNKRHYIDVGSYLQTR